MSGKGSTAVPGRGLWIAWRRWSARVFALLLLLAAVFAPVLANDVPIAARVDGHWQFPALRSYFGPPPPGPHETTWPEWVHRAAPGSGDLAWMPPWPCSPTATDLERLLAGPSLEHPFGNDDTGRDVLSRLVHGCATGVGLGGIAVLFGGLLGVTLGALAGLRGGLVDAAVLRAMEICLCFPPLLLMLTAAAFFGTSVTGMVIVMAGLYWTSFARIVRGELLALRERDFVLAARGLGVRTSVLVRRHLLPQVRGQVAVTAAFCLAQAVILESTLSFLGLGPGANASSWGSVLQQGKANAHLGAWHLWAFPGALLVATVLCCHGLAEQVRTRRPD